MSSDINNYLICFILNIVNCTANLQTKFYCFEISFETELLPW